MLRKPESKTDEIGLDLKASLLKSRNNAIPLCRSNNEYEKETQSQFKWVKEGKTMIRKKIVE